MSLVSPPAGAKINAASAWLEMLAVSGLLPVAVLAVVLNLVLPEDVD